MKQARKKIEPSSKGEVNEVKVELLVEIKVELKVEQRVTSRYTQHTITDSIK